MSHFSVAVVVESAESPSDAISQAEIMLKPFDENLKLSSPEKVYLSEDEEKTFRRVYSSLDEISWENFRTVMVKIMEEKFGEDCGHDKGGFYHLSTCNPDSRWDWYLFGGRWNNFYKVKDGVNPEDYGSGAPGVFGEEPVHGTYADVIQLKNIDFEHMTTIPAHEADVAWDRVEKVIERLGFIPKDYETVLLEELKKEFPKILSDRCVESSDAQKIIGELLDGIELDSSRHTRIMEAVGRAKANLERSIFISALKEKGLIPDIFPSDPVKYFRLNSGGREEFVKSKSRGSYMTYAILDKDGWNDREEVIDSQNEQMRNWEDVYDTLLESYHEDSWIVLVDCHI